MDMLGCGLFACDVKIGFQKTAEFIDKMLGDLNTHPFLVCLFI